MNSDVKEDALKFCQNVASTLDIIGTEQRSTGLSSTVNDCLVLAEELETLTELVCKAFFC